MANLKIYENMDRIDYEKFFNEAGCEWPRNKRYTVVSNGIEFKIGTYLSKGDEMIGGGYDAYSAIDTMLTRDEVVERMIQEDPNGGSDAVAFASAKFDDDKLVRLTVDQDEIRANFLAAVANLINNPDAIKAIADAAPKKKNGTFHKNRIMRIASSGIADGFSGVYAIVGRVRSDNTMSILVECTSCKPGDNELWDNDFISTYHDGLRLSELLKEVL